MGKNAVELFFLEMMVLMGTTVKEDMAAIHKRYAFMRDWMAQRKWNVNKVAPQILCLLWAQKDLLVSHPGKQVHRFLSSHHGAIKDHMVMPTRALSTEEQARTKHSMLRRLRDAFENSRAVSLKISLMKKSKGTMLPEDAWAQARELAKAEGTELIIWADKVRKAPRKSIARYAEEAQLSLKVIEHCPKCDSVNIMPPSELGDEWLCRTCGHCWDY